MKKTALLSALAVLVCSAALFTQVQPSSSKEPTLAAPQLDDTFVCSDATLTGAYGLSTTGTRPAPPPPSGTPNYIPGTIEQVIGVGTRTFDGAGNFTQVTNEKGSLSGILFHNRALQGTYSLNPDCSGTLTIIIPGPPFSVVFDIVVTNHGREFQSIVTSPQASMVSTVGRKVN